MNFLKETETKIFASGHSIKDVMFIGTEDGKFRIAWWKFVEMANFDYDSGFGIQEIPSLIVYFKDNTYMFRNEYDGSEWWEYKVNKIFKESDDYKSFILKPNDDDWGYKIEGVTNEQRY